MTFISLSLILALRSFGPTAGTTVPGYEGDVKAVFDRAFKEYGLLKSYQDSLTSRIELKIDKPEMLANEPAPRTATLAFVPPNKVLLKTEELDLYSDGKELVRHMGSLDQYAVSSLSGSINLANPPLNRSANAIRQWHPLFTTVTGANQEPAGLFEGVVQMIGSNLVRLVEFKGVKAESLAGKAGKRVSGALELDDRSLPADLRIIPFTVWFSDESGLVGEVFLDLTRAGPTLTGAGDQVKVLHMSIRAQAEDIRINQDIPDARFTFKPGPFDEKVEQFTQPDPQTWQRKLINRPAPPIAGKDLDGKPVKLEDFKGKVVLLDFWATWCGPCIMAMPGLQKVSDKFADKNVAVLGVNTDAPGQDKNVSRLLSSKKVTYRQILDPQGRANRAYRISGIPCMILVDQKGVIRDILAGFSPDHESLLAARIDQLLKGESSTKTN